MTLVLLVGGARSGKSALAVRLAAETGALVVFVATAEAQDEEMRERIAAHRAERPSEWKTVEAPTDLAAAIGTIDEEATVIVDCLSLWVANLLESETDVEAKSCLVAALASLIGQGARSLSATRPDSGSCQRTHSAAATAICSVAPTPSGLHMPSARS